MNLCVLPSAGVDSIEIQMSKSRVSNRRGKSEREVEMQPAEMPKFSTPVRGRQECDEDDTSPILMKCTQDGGENELDVVWDWYSPQAKHNLLKARKRSVKQSPKALVRKSAQSSGPQFNRLKAELEALASQLEAVNTPKPNVAGFTFAKPMDMDALSGEEDLFGDDSMNETILRASQQVEANFNHNNEAKKVLPDDSFDAVLQAFKDEDIDLLTQACLTEPKPAQESPPKLPRFNFRPSESISPSRSLQFKSKSLPYTLNSARSLEKRYQISQQKASSTEKLSEVSEPSTSVQCSTEEIEMKRSLAKAKRDLKQQHELIERKRREALLKREQRRAQKGKEEPNSKFLVSR